MGAQWEKLANSMARGPDDEEFLAGLMLCAPEDRQHVGDQLQQMIDAAIRLKPVVLGTPTPEG